jgi:adenylylsulfate kinase
MIYYSNSPLDQPHMAFIGRWSPFHKGHEALVTKKLLEQPTTPVLMLVRNTTTDAYTPLARAHYLKLWMIKKHIKGTIMIIPNIEGIYWGRGVGYNVGLVDVDVKTQRISGTRIRDRIKRKRYDWKRFVGLPSSAHLLSPKIATIIDRGVVIWLTGCPASGKTTIAKTLLHTIRAQYPFVKTQLLDGDDMRASPLAQHIGFSPEDRADHIIRMAYLAKMFADHGILVVCAFVSPERRIREKAKAIIGKARFYEIYVKASKRTRMRRDTKGLYKKASKGYLTNLTGYDARYEPPLRPFAVCNTDKLSLRACIQALQGIFL